MSIEESTSTPEPPAPNWGDPISAECQAELQGMLDAWDAPGADHGDKKGPFAGVSLTGTPRAALNRGAGMAPAHVASYPRALPSLAPLIDFRNRL